MTSHRSFISRAAYAAVILLVIPVATALQNGDAICTEGYIMDNFCIQRGTLLDRPSVATLERPDLHSVHCLVDVGICRDSGYVVLQDPVVTGALYTLGYQVDTAGTTTLINLARHVGNGNGCSTCTSSGHLAEGFRAAVLGTVLDATANPPLISVDSAVAVDASTEWCATQGVDVSAVVPSATPSQFPTSFPTTSPSSTPTIMPSSIPTALPTALPSFVPTSSPTTMPSTMPTTETAIPTLAPTSSAPTSSLAPSVVPTSLPTLQPSSVPTDTPSSVPTTSIVVPATSTSPSVVVEALPGNIVQTTQTQANETTSATSSFTVFRAGIIWTAMPFIALVMGFV